MKNPNRFSETLIESVLRILECSLHCKVSLDLDTAEEVLRRFQKYNFIPLNLHEIVERVKKAIGPVDFGPSNPNTGTFSNIEFSIGNEFSLVIYVKSLLFYRKGDKAARQIGELKTIGQVFGADEVDVEHDDFRQTLTARFWWDQGGIGDQPY